MINNQIFSRKGWRIARVSNYPKIVLGIEDDLSYFRSVVMECGHTSNRNIFEINQSYEIPILKDNNDTDDEDSLDYIERKFKEIVQSQGKVKPVKAPNRTSTGVSLYGRFIESLEKRIHYLEGELSKKDKFIETIFEKSTTKSNFKSCDISSEHIAFNFDTPITERKDVNVNGNDNNGLDDPRRVSSETPIKSAQQKVDKQLSNVRSKLHSKYIISKPAIQKKSVSIVVSPEKKGLVKVIVCGDSMTNGLDSREISSKNVKSIVRSFSGATTTDMLDFTKPFIEKKPDLLFLHFGTNDLTKGIKSTVENFKQVMNNIKKASPTISVIISDICLREDRPGIDEKRTALNKKIHQLAKELNISVLNNGNIDSSCLSRKKLHLNRKEWRNWQQILNKELKCLIQVD